MSVLIEKMSSKKKSLILYNTCYREKCLNGWKICSHTQNQYKLENL